MLPKKGCRLVFSLKMDRFLFSDFRVIHRSSIDSINESIQYLKIESLVIGNIIILEPHNKNT